MVSKSNTYYIEFTASHFSPYAFAVDKNGSLTDLATEKLNNGPSDEINSQTESRTELIENVPDTGDKSNALLSAGFLSILALAGTVLFLYRKKRL